MASNDWPEEVAEVAEWFWNENKTAISKKGKNLIRELNSAALGNKGVRYEEQRPHIYAVKVKRMKLVIETSAGTQKMTLVKVGYTHTDTSTYNNDTRINTLMKDIKKTIKKSWNIEADCVPIFVLPIDALDTRQFTDIEAEVRSRVGINVPKNIGKTLRVPVPTEWVVTTKAFITVIRSNIKRLKELKEAARSETKVQPPAARRKQQEVKPKKEQSTGEKLTPTSSKQELPARTPASAPSYVMPGSTTRIKQDEVPLRPDVEPLTETMGNMILCTNATNPPGAAPAKDETPLKKKKTIRIDTGSIFGEYGLRFNERFVSGVQGAFGDIEKYKEREINVDKITENDGKINLKLMKSKKTQPG